MMGCRLLAARMVRMSSINKQGISYISVQIALMIISESATMLTSLEKTTSIAFSMWKPCLHGQFQIDLSTGTVAPKHIAMPGRKKSRTKNQMRSQGAAELADHACMASFK